MWERGGQRAECTGQRQGSCQLQEQLRTSHTQPHCKHTPATHQLYTSHTPTAHQPHVRHTPATHQLYTSYTPTSHQPLSKCTPASLCTHGKGDHML